MGKIKSASEERIKELEERIRKLEEWYSAEIKRKEKRIEELERERDLFRSAALKEAEKQRQAGAILERLKKRIEEQKK